ncbi:MAG: hypothetical protein SGI87_01215, partial [Flavobacteriales bacterium]|nr:hypothetical protein [Flavobacteriales bacterium]
IGLWMKPNRLFFTQRSRRNCRRELGDFGYISFKPCMSGLWKKPNRFLFHEEIAEELPQRTRRLWVIGVVTDFVNST